jgi:hypothetical protein
MGLSVQQNKTRSPPLLPSQGSVINGDSPDAAGGFKVGKVAQVKPLRLRLRWAEFPPPQLKPQVRLW